MLRYHEDVLLGAQMHIDLTVGDIDHDSDVDVHVSRLNHKEYRFPRDEGCQGLVGITFALVFTIKAIFLL